MPMVPLCVLVCCLLTWLLPAGVSAAPAGPGWRESDLPAVEARPALPVGRVAPSVRTAPTDALVSAALAGSGYVVDAITPELQRLADGLQRDPTQIYAYVRNTIVYEHYYGAKKGAMLTWLEGSGNDFDQAALLVALLRAAGYPAQYRAGRQRIPYADTVNGNDLVQWLGLAPQALTHLTWSEALAQHGWAQDPWPAIPDVQRKKNYLFALHFLHNRGTPNLLYDTNLTALQIFRVWVQVTINGVVYELDPSLKPHQVLPGIDLQAAAGYNRATLLQAAGGMTDGVSVQALNEEALATTLTTYTAQLRETLRTTAPQATPREIVGGLQLVPQALAPLPQQLPRPAVEPITTWDAIPASECATLTLTLGGSPAITKLLPELQGQKLALTFTGDTAFLWLDDTLLTSAPVPGPTVSLSLLVHHPHPGDLHDQTETKTYRKGEAYAYALAYGFTPSDGLLRQRQARLEQLRQTAKAAYPQAVNLQGVPVPQLIPDATLRGHLLTEMLNVLGLQWLYQTALSEQLLGAQRAVLPLMHHRVGRVAQEEGYYLDVTLQFSGRLSRSGQREAEQTFSTVNSFFASAMEHGVLEQIPGTTNPAASTMKLMQLANRSPDPTRDEVFLVTPGTFETVLPRLQGYTPSLVQTLRHEANAGATLLLTEHAEYTLKEWTGTGYVTVTPGRRGMIITGGYHGGYAGRRGPFDPQAGTRADDRTGTTPELYGGDPVEMRSGAFVLQHTDLSLGAAAPRGIQVVRSYHSGRVPQDPAQLGAGWRHTYTHALGETSDFQAALGTATAAEMVPYLVATMAAIEVFSSATTPTTWATAALIANWGVEQLRQNAVVITLGTDTVQFLRYPDGTYQGPANTPMTLTREPDGSYLLRERLGNTYHFSALLGHRLYTITDPDGLTLTCAYDGAWRLATLTDAYQRQVVFTYTNGRLTALSDSTGRTVTYAYDGQGNLQAVTDPERGAPTTFAYDAGHRLTVVCDALGRVVTRNTYDADGRVVEQRSADDPQQTWRLTYGGVLSTQTDPLGGTTRYFYDARGRAMGTENALGQRTLFAYDGQDHLIRRTTAKGEVTQWTYDADHNLRQVTDPLGATTTTAYDALHRPLQITQHDPAATPATRVTTFTYLPGNLTARPDTVTDPRGLLTRYVYNRDGTLREQREERASGTYITSFSYTYSPNGGPLETVTITAPDGTTTQQTYTLWGDVATVRDATGFVTLHLYNTRRQRVSTTTPDLPLNGITYFRYDAVGDLVETRSPKGVLTRSTYSATGKLLTVTTAADTPEAQTVTQTYDARDWLVATTTATGATTQFTYDAAERLVARRDPLGRITRFAVDANGQRTVLTQPSTTRTTQWTYNARGQHLSQTAPDGATTSWAPTAFTTLHRLTPPGQAPYTFTTDANGQRLTTRTPLGFVTTQTWNDRNLLATGQTPASGTTTFTYDAQGRPATQTDPLGTRIRTYDAAGNLHTVQEGSAVSSRTYDSRHRVASYTDARGRTMRYAYDLHGNLTQLTYPDGQTVTYTYDRHDRLKTVRDWAGRLTQYTWDAAHRLTRLQRPNGTTRQLTYDRAGQLLRVEERDAEGVLLALVQLTYDLDGYPQQRLVLPVPPALVVPALALAVDADNRVTTANGLAVTHDADGRLTTGPLPSGAPGTYTWDVRHRLQAAGGVTYAHDAEGFRTALTSSAGTLRYTVDPHGGALPRVLVRETPDGRVTRAVYGLGLLYEVEASGTVRYYHYDETGSTIALTDPTGLVVTDRMGYGPFGTLVVRTGTTTTPYLYGGLFGVETDPNGLLYMRARYYHLGLRRFLSPDPIGFAGGLNWYAYVGNNPYQFADPTGLGKQGLVEEGRLLIQQVAPRGESLDDYFRDPGTVVTPAEVLVAQSCPMGGFDITSPTKMCGLGGGGGFGGPMRSAAPNFIVSPNGTAFPVPKGAQGPSPVINPSGNQTGVAFTGGGGGANGQVSTMRIMDPTPPRGASPGYPNGYIKYENSASPRPQGVDPYTGKTLPNAGSHFPIQ